MARPKPSGRRLSSTSCSRSFWASSASSGRTESSAFAVSRMLMWRTFQYYLKAKRSAKRGASKTPLDEALGIGRERNLAFDDLDEARDRPITVTTAKREWRTARLWLYRFLDPSRSTICTSGSSAELLPCRRVPPSASPNGMPPHRRRQPSGAGAELGACRSASITLRTLSRSPSEVYLRLWSRICPQR